MLEIHQDKEDSNLDQKIAFQATAEFQHKLDVKL
jgi:hypothetical protein